MSAAAPALLRPVFPRLTGHKRRFRPRFILAFSLLLGLVALSGCGTVVDREKLQDTVQASLESSIHEKIKEVECPSDQSVDPGATFTCDVIFSDDRREVATLKIRNEDADISMVGLKPEK
jgi:chromosome condensin MukBEF MukE localization factor